ncbi:MAG TPA: hypothetical protein VFJ29_02095 [Candidatus Kapabacteria bacterium]|nr:hypothetical protein [Candidatus Kapabacteria bacterium]
MKFYFLLKPVAVQYKIGSTTIPMFSDTSFVLSTTGVSNYFDRYTTVLMLSINSFNSIGL